ncbi:glycosyltransferase family 1 protein [uncultured Draconibacterium sp.]|uniref:glycosyltransferase family 4 protein n=1 Tax=uncultured Draconibacterium sp. TaxID=1573823 RepID=UPI0032168EAC
MKVLYDHQIFYTQKYGGISRYFFELMREFRSFKEVEVLFPTIFSNNYYLSNSEAIHNITYNLNNKHLINAITKYNSLNTNIKLRLGNYDVFHPTYYNPKFLKYLRKKPFVLTVHDMTHEKYKHLFSADDKTSEKKRYLVEKARKIIAVSENTKRDLVDLFGIEESKVDVVYHGNSIIQENILESFTQQLPAKYLLFVGGRWGYKNFENFIKAITPILADNQELSIVCTGGGDFIRQETELFSKLKIQNRVFQYSVNDSGLGYIYRNAICFVFPSLYEGFGIPILEAFSNQCPVVCSDTSSLPEVAGEAACYFDPNDLDSIFESVQQVLSDHALQHELISKGLKRVELFSWEKTAAKTKLVYESIL